MGYKRSTTIRYCKACLTKANHHCQIPHLLMAEGGAIRTFPLEKRVQPQSTGWHGAMHCFTPMDMIRLRLTFMEKRFEWLRGSIAGIWGPRINMGGCKTRGILRRSPFGDRNTPVPDARKQSYVLTSPPSYIPEAATRQMMPGTFAKTGKDFPRKPR